MPDSEEKKGQERAGGDEGRSGHQGRGDREAGSDHGGENGHDGHGDHHKQMVADFRRRFWISAALTVPVLVLAPLIQDLLGVREALSFPGDSFVQWALASIIFVYGGRPFLKGLVDEIGDKSPGMMTLIGLAISVAYGYSSLVVFGLPGKVFFWELATLVDVMLLGHWIEMRAVMGASSAQGTSTRCCSTRRAR